MNIRLINCDHVHIFDETTFVYAADGIYELDSVSTRLISILKSDSSFDYVVSQTEKQMELDDVFNNELISRPLSQLKNICPNIREPDL